jgi:hypothetical protein
VSDKEPEVTMRSTADADAGTSTAAEGAHSEAGTLERKLEAWG